jgi:GTPase SAR1 family protein
MSDELRAGFCAIVGLPNVGKSTLLNRILGRHLVAVSAKPQTTRDRIVGVHAIELPGEEPPRAQIAYVDTPGLQDGRGPLRRYMREAALAAASDADVVLVLVDATDRRGRTPERMAEPDSAPLGAASRAHRHQIISRIAKTVVTCMMRRAWPLESCTPLMFSRQKYSVNRTATPTENRFSSMRKSWLSSSLISLISAPRYCPALTPLMGPVRM